MPDSLDQAMINEYLIDLEKSAESLLRESATYGGLNQVSKDRISKVCWKLSSISGGEFDAETVTPRQ